MTAQQSPAGLLATLALGLSMTFAPVQAAADGSASATAQANAISVWVELDAPALSSLHGASKAERETLRQRIDAQQDAVMLQLRELGAQEQARVQVLRNALAVRIPLQQVEAARQIAGVRSVKRIRHMQVAPPARDHQ
jgi:hypothetical protein